MRKQVIEIFSEWIEFYVPHKIFKGYWLTEFQIWCDNNHPEASKEVREAVCDCFRRKPTAYCDWYVDSLDKTINVVIRSPKK